jgi:hypothetical protein
VLERDLFWPEADQEELAQYAEHIESLRDKAYQATAQELEALEEAEHSGIASEQEVEAAFRSFRRP